MFKNMKTWISFFWFGLFYSEGETQLNVPCDPGYIPSPLSGSCLKFHHREKETWTDAESICKRSRAHLLAIKDSGMEKFVKGLLPNNTNSYWIGLETNTNFVYSWHHNHGLANYVNVKRFDATPQNALLIKNQRHWSLVSGSEKHSFICELEPEELCQEDLTVSPHSGTCLLLSVLEQKYDWMQARQTCQGIGGDLVITLNRAMFNFVSDLFAVRNLIGGNDSDVALENKDYWVGLNDFKTEGTFQWLEFPDQVTFTAWDSGQPDDNRTRSCGLFNYRGRPYWHDYNCTRKSRFVCEMYSDCKNKKWGMICPKKCAQTNCKGEFDNPGSKSTSCNVRTGHCYYGCDDGYKGIYCDIPVSKKDPRKYLIYASIFAMSIFPIVICIALSMKCLGHKKEEVGPEQESFGGFIEALQSDTVPSGQEKFKTVSRARDSVNGTLLYAETMSQKSSKEGSKISSVKSSGKGSGKGSN